MLGFVCTVLLAAAAAAKPQALCIGDACQSIPAVHDVWDPAQQPRYAHGMTNRADLAFRWYLSSAKKGDARAMHNSGLMLVRGMGVDNNPLEGRSWLEQAEGRGVAEAALALGNLSRPTDPASATGYYRQAAEWGDVRAMHALANMIYAATVQSDPDRRPIAGTRWRQRRAMLPLTGHAGASGAK